VAPASPGSTAATLPRPGHASRHGTDRAGMSHCHGSHWPKGKGARQLPRAPLTSRTITLTRQPPPAPAWFRQPEGHDALLCGQLCLDLLLNPGGVWSPDGVGRILDGGGDHGFNTGLFGRDLCKLLVRTKRLTPRPPGPAGWDDAGCVAAPPGGCQTPRTAGPSRPGYSD
jgi:hypothetical protein